MEGKTSSKVRLSWFFNEKESFEGKLVIDGKTVFDGEKFQKFNLFDGSKVEFTAKIVDAQEELSKTTITEEEKALYEEGLKEASFTSDSFGWDELGKILASIVGSTAIYDLMLTNHPELKDTNICIENKLSVTKNGTTLLSSGTRTYFNGTLETF